MSRSRSLSQSSQKRIASPSRSKTLPTPSFQLNVEDYAKPLTNAESHDPVRELRAGNPLRQSSTWSTTARNRRRGSAWQRKHSPGVAWRKRWDESHYPWASGRILIIDCFSRVHSDDGKRKTESYEFNTIEELREFYETGPGSKNNNHVLRIIHVQNAEKAREFLLRKFNISHKQDITGTAFGRWANYDRPQRRAGKPVLNAKSFQTSRDPWRGVSRTGFGFDYLKGYRPHMISDDEEEADWKLMELNYWDQERGNVPAHGYDVYVQRLACYIQRSEGPVNLSPDEDMKNPYLNQGRNGSIPMEDYNENDALPLMESMDNNSTIIVFEASQSHAAEDTMIQARKEIETRWRRLMHLLPREEIATEDLLTVELMNIVLKDLFRALQHSWEKTISKSDEHVSILEDKIYENPADESRAPELWTNQSLWLKVEKLISLQIGVINEVQNNMKEIVEDDQPHDEWLKNTPDEFKGVETMIQEQLVKPTANLSDLMYKSVGIRDARDSLRLGLSMWRLSWITFIFLPLTFMVGFFGMNVDTFQPPSDPDSASPFPSLKWYFIAAVPLMAIVVIFYFIFKRTDADRRHDPVERGAYEHIYHDFAADYPDLWSRFGPKSDSVRPVGWWSTLKWRLVTYWFDPATTIAARPISDVDEMTLWPQIKRRITMRWLRTIKTKDTNTSLDHAETGLIDWTGRGRQSVGQFSPTENLVAMSMPIGLADANPIIAAKLARRFLPRRSRSRSRSLNFAARRMAENRPLSQGSEGVMVDEERSDDDEGDSSGYSGSDSLGSREKRGASVKVQSRRNAYEGRTEISQVQNEAIGVKDAPGDPEVADKAKSDQDRQSVESINVRPGASDDEKDKKVKFGSLRGTPRSSPKSSPKLTPSDFLGVPLKLSKGGEHVP